MDIIRTVYYIRGLELKLIFAVLDVQGRINHGAKRAMAQGPRRKGPSAPPRNFFRLFNCHLYRELFE